MATKLCRNDEYGVDLRGEPANIKRLVAALNAHAGLVAACQAALLIIGDAWRCAESQDHKRAASLVGDQIKAALAATEAKPNE